MFQPLFLQVTQQFVEYMRTRVAKYSLVKIYDQYNAEFISYIIQINKGNHGRSQSPKNATTVAPLSVNARAEPRLDGTPASAKRDTKETDILVQVIITN